MPIENAVRGNEPGKAVERFEDNLDPRDLPDADQLVIGESVDIGSSAQRPGDAAGQGGRHRVVRPSQTGGSAQSAETPLLAHAEGSTAGAVDTSASVAILDQAQDVASVTISAQADGSAPVGGVPDAPPVGSGAQADAGLQGSPVRAGPGL